MYGLGLCLIGIVSPSDPLLKDPTVGVSRGSSDRGEKKMFFKIPL